MGGVSRVLIGDGGHVSNNSGIVIKFVDKDMLNGRRRMRYREVTAYRLLVAAVPAGLKNDDVLFSQSVALLEISNDCDSCSGLLDTACLIPSHSLKETVG